jgi:predicted RNA-binding Zn-ribbon protein involved in translation (DUF1610 family)
VNNTVYDARRAGVRTIAGAPDQTRPGRGDRHGARDADRGNAGRRSAPTSTTASAIAGPPVGISTQWKVIVLRCPPCGALHIHRCADAAALFAGRIYRRCPVTRARYVLAPSHKAVAS